MAHGVKQLLHWVSAQNGNIPSDAVQGGISVKGMIKFCMSLLGIMIIGVLAPL